MSKKTKHNNSQFKSKCCHEAVRVSCSPDEIDKIGCTMYYTCTGCQEACDVFIPERKTWTINPKTRVVPNKKKQNNKLFTDKELKKFLQGEDF